MLGVKTIAYVTLVIFEKSLNPKPFQDDGCGMLAGSATTSFQLSPTQHRPNSSC